MALIVDNEMFMMHIAIREREKMPMHSKKQAQVRALLFDKASTEVPVKYSNYNAIFSAENAAELLKNTRINEHVIE